MSLIIKDRRGQSGGKSTGNKQKFLKRVKGTIQTTGHAIINGKVGNTNSSGNVNINKKALSEPTFVYAGNGNRKIVLPGNYKFVRGDTIDLEGDGQGSGSGSGSGQGENGEDGFSVEISRDEFLDFFFEDLELPNLQKTDDSDIMEMTNQPAGYVTDGPPSKLSIIQSKKKAKMRKLALTAGSRKKLTVAEEELDLLIKEMQASTDMDDTTTLLYEMRIKALQEKISKLNHKIKNVPALEEIDLRFRSNIRVPVKTSKAVIFFIMDNSGSMGQAEKTLARKFFTLLYLFVQRKYGNADLVFISHTSFAREMDEEEFFNTHESGGTTVSTALKLCSKIINERYSDKNINIYVNSAGDGDNWTSDNAVCFRELAHNILPRVQHYSYIQVGEMGFTNDAEIWATMNLIGSHTDKLDAVKIRTGDDIYPAFRSMFAKRPQGVTK